MIGSIPVGDWVERGVEFLLAHFGTAFSLISVAVGGLTLFVEQLLLAIPAWLFTLALCGLAWARVSASFTVFTAAALALISGMGLWVETMATLALVLSATLLSLLVGLPLGVLSAKRDRAERALHPLLDFMQTMPAFVYLIPAVMFFGLGRVPGTIATLIFCMPPAVRLTNLGIRGVPGDLVEAGRAFGCTPRQLLLKVELPQALPSIMAGVNQTTMLALSMVVIASMIGAGGLGNEVLRAIQRLDVGLGFESGLAVVVLAIVLDRISQSFGERGRGDLRRRVRRVFDRVLSGLGRGPR
jgi:glycine betaine/proline transport system permease protein